MGTGKKRPILLWQMIVLVVLPLTVIVSAFFPRISISDGKIVDAYKDVYEFQEWQADFWAKVVWMI